MSQGMNDLLVGLSDSFCAEDMMLAGLEASICSEIISQRIKRNMTQKEFAEFMGVSQGLVSKWEKGLVVPSAETIKKIADYFQVSTDFIVTEHPDDFQIKKRR